MNDLISRAQAIDGKICIQRANGVEIYDDYAVPVEYLEQLPPVNNSEKPNSSDAISRADAIKIVQNRCKRHTTACVLAVTEIKQLPPIQPASCSEFPSNSDVVDRQKAKNAICNACGKIDCDEMDTCEKLDIPSEGSKLLQPWEVLVAQAVLSQPAEPKRGKWIRTGSGSLYDHYECSECGKAPKWDCMGDNRWKIAFTDFCPNCGAKMEVDHESN